MIREKIIEAALRTSSSVVGEWKGLRKTHKKRPKGRPSGSGKWTRKNEHGLSCNDWIFLQVTRIMREDQVGQHEACRRLFGLLLREYPTIEVSRRGQGKEGTYKGKIKTGGDQLYMRYRVALEAFEAREARPLSELFSMSSQSYDLVRN